MKNLMYCLLALTTLTFFSCQKDTDYLPAKTKNLIGDWEVDRFSYIEGQDDIRHPEVSVAEASNGIPFRIEINKDETFQAFGEGIALIGTYTAKRLKGEYANGKEFRHGDLEFNFSTPIGNHSDSDNAFITLLKKTDTFIFNGVDLTIHSSPAATGGWSRTATFEKQ